MNINERHRWCEIVSWTYTSAGELPLRELPPEKSPPKPNLSPDSSPNLNNRGGILRGESVGGNSPVTDLYML